MGADADAGKRSVKYKQRFRPATRTPMAFQCRHHRQHCYYAMHIATRRVQQNGFRWYCLELRKKRLDTPRTPVLP